MRNSINCSVEQCRYNDHEQNCTLNSVNVGCTTSNPQDCCDTECDSFEENC